MTRPIVTVIEVGKAVIDADTVYTEPVHFVVEDGIIREIGVGPYVPKTGQRVDRYVRKGDRVAIPGLVNTHGHAAMTLLRGAGDDMPLMSWLHDRIFPIEARLTEECIYWGTLLASWEMLTSGTTTYTDMYMMMDRAAQAVAESGIRGVLSVGVVGLDEADRENGIRRSRDFVANWHGACDGRIQVTLGPHAPYTCPENYLREIAELALELGVGLQIHLSETRVEVDDCLGKTGLTPIALAERAGLFRVPTLAAHCVHVTDDDIEIMRANAVHVAHNPQSNLKLGSGVAPLPRMLERGLIVGLGTDGAASNNNLDMFEEMRLAAILHKGIHEDAQCVNAATAFRMASEMGAAACFQTQGAGALRVGSPCDMVLLDGKSPRMLPQHNLLSDVVYAVGAEDVRDVFVAGEMVVQNGEPLAIDTERVAYEVKRLRDRLQP
ncbi:N-ethylammeline chlorohydrolase [Alicyclobacillus tengchongensis]|nr:N-ethylammeline chlorohydrolase [Alicyclobacillus tengchongensis]